MSKFKDDKTCRNKTKEKAKKMFVHSEENFSFSGENQKTFSFLFMSLYIL